MFRGSKSFFNSRKRDGKISVAKQVNKVYLRTDIPCGSLACAVCAESDEGTSRCILKSDAENILIPDTNVVLHNIDAIEHPAVTDVVILDTVLNEVKSLNKGVYARLAKIVKDPEGTKRFHVFGNENHVDTASEQEAGESSNDHNDRLIRAAAKWYQLHLQQGNVTSGVILLTHDIANKRKAKDMGIPSLSMSEYVTKHVADNAELLDTVQTAAPAENERNRTRQAIYAAHLNKADVDRKLASGQLLKGALRQSSTNMHEGTVSVLAGEPEEGKRKQFVQYLIASKVTLNRCLDGDVVAIRVFPVEEWTKPSRLLKKEERKALNVPGKDNRPRALTADAEEAKARGFLPTAEIVGLIQNNRKPLCGSIMWDEEDKKSTAQVAHIHFRPMKGNCPYIRLQTRQVSQWIGKRLQVVIDDWKVDSPYPEGHCVKVLGDIGDKDVEAEVILLENDVPHYEFSQKVLDCLPQGDWAVEASEEAVRTDFRSKCVVSVDPPGCKDIDDALHCERLPNGNLSVGVHIADVTHFMKEGTPIDEEAAKRSTSVYLVDRRIDMLPKLLTENLCSLVGNEERYTFSVVWEMTPNAEVVNTTFTKGIIKSRSAMSYYTAQAMVDDKKDNSEIATGLKHLLALSKILKQKRVDAGALTLASQEMKFTMDMEAGNATDVSEYIHIPTMSMIEEFMLFANVAVAAKIEKEFPLWACLRRHPAPADGSMDTLNEALEAQGMPTLDASTSLQLANTLDACNDKSDSYFNRLVRILVTRNMQQAKYFSSGEFDRQQYWHYGLAMEIYTHFTSPIRRFSDVVVHRQLAAAIGLTKRSRQHMDEQVMAELTDNMNFRHTSAQHAGRDSRNLYIGFVFDHFKDGKKEIPVQDAYVVRVMENGVVVMVPRYGVEGTVYFEEFPELQKKGFRQLDKLTVKLTLRPGSHDDVSRNKLLYEIVEHVVVTRAPCREAENKDAEVDAAKKNVIQPVNDCTTKSEATPSQQIRKKIRVTKKKTIVRKSTGAAPAAKRPRTDDGSDGEEL